jgi:hypothetical protein
MRKLLKKYRFAPDKLVTDDLRSYRAAAQDLGNSYRHERGRWRNNRAENSHQSTRRRKRKMQGSAPLRLTSGHPTVRHNRFRHLSAFYLQWQVSESPIWLEEGLRKPTSLTTFRRFRRDGGAAPFLQHHTVPLISWLRSQLNLLSSGLIPTLNRIRPEGRKPYGAKSKGGISMTKTIMVHRNPSAPQTLKTPINSIIAAVKTAHDLESARRKATRDKASGPWPRQGYVEAWGALTS